MNRVVNGDNASNHKVVPKNVSLRSSNVRCSVISSSIIELKSVCEGLSTECTSGGLSVTDEVVLRIESEVLSNLVVNVTIEFANLRGPMIVIN